MEYSSSEVVQKLFNVDINEYRKFKDSITTLEGKKNSNSILKPKMIDIPGQHNKKRVYLEEQFIYFFNVIIIQGFFPKPKIISELLNDFEARSEQADFLSDTLLDRSEVGKIKLKPEEIKTFLDELKNPNFDFHNKRLTNPFSKLPQLENISLIGALAHENKATRESTMMMEQYFSGNLSESYEISKKITESEGIVSKYKERIEKEYREAEEFDSLLDSFKK